MERDLTLDYASSSDDSQFFLTRSHGMESEIESSFQHEMESYSSEKTCDESQSLVKNNKKGSKSKKCRWLRSNRVSPDQPKSEVEGKYEQKSKARRLATSFAKGIRKSINNV